MFITSYSFSYDPSKKNVLVLKASEQYSYIFGFINTIANKLAKDYNVFCMSFEKQNTEHCSIKINERSITRELKKHSITKKEFKESKRKENSHYDVNHGILYDIIEKNFPNLPSIDYIIIGYDVHCMLPYGKITGAKTYYTRYNEFFDYTGTDESVLDKINTETKNIVSNINKQINPLAFSQIHKSIVLNILRFLTTKYKNSIKSLDTFIIDPAQFHPMYELFDVPYRCFYFENDTRGNRNFKKFPIAQLQHCVYDKSKQTSINSEKDKCFMFTGTIFSNKINRIIVYEDFLRNLRLDNSVLYIPLAKGGIFRKEPSEKVSENNKKRILNKYDDDFYMSVVNHPMHKGHILPEDLYAELGRYKYAFVARCTSYNDSLNYRPVLYVQNNVLPIIDYMYDPENLSIPKEIYDKISVKNHTEIEEHIKYFEEHPEERIKIINKLKDLFEIQKFYDSDYIEEIVRNTWK